MNWIRSNADWITIFSILRSNIRSALSRDWISDLQIELASRDQILDLELKLSLFDTFYLILMTKQMSSLGFGKTLITLSHKV